MLIVIRELKQTCCRRQREHHMKNVNLHLYNPFLIIQRHYACKMYSSYILELNWNRSFRYKKAKLNICHLLIQTTEKQVVWHHGKDENVQKWKMQVQSMQNYCFSLSNNIHEKISPFWLVKSSAVFFLNSAEKS